MKNNNKYFLLVPAILSFGFVNPSFSQLICGSESGYSNNESREIHSTVCSESNDLMKYFMDQSFQNSTRYKDSNTLQSQLHDIFGVKHLFQKEKRAFGFPEQRMFKDAHILWESFQKAHQLQVRPISKSSSDIPSGIDSSLLR